MEKINVAELLRNCPKGMELDCTMFDGVYFDHIDDLRLNRIKCYVNNGNEHFEIALDEHGQYLSNHSAKCVIYPKGKTTWEGFQRPYFNGDIVCTNCDSIAILGNRIYSESFYSYCGLFNHNFDFNVIVSPKRLATEEEKAKLFKAIKDNGYKWNEETKTLENIKPRFKDGDVIVCENECCTFISIFKEKTPERKSFRGYCVFILDDSEFKVRDSVNSVSYFNKARFATKREKELLFRAIEKNGYKWNEKTKTLEKLNEQKFKVGDRVRHKTHISQGNVVIEIKDTYYILDDESELPFIFQDEYELVPKKFDVSKLKPFESRVLVRTEFFHDKWIAGFFSHKDSDGFAPFWTTADKNYQQCIPYEGNEHLLGKTDDCDKYFNTWE